MSATLPPLDIDMLQPFTLEGAAVRGRLVRLGLVVDTILSRHAYPDPVSRVLGEVLVVASMLTSNLKQEGIFTIQIRGNGAVPLMVVDATYGGQLRGYADVVGDAATLLAAHANHPSLKALMGEDSYLAITYDPGKGMQRYQGVVALVGATISDALQSYFTQSQQIDVWFALACDRIPGTHTWAAGGVMIEKIADSGGMQSGGEGARSAHSDYAADEAWRTALALSNTVKPEELLDGSLPLTELLFRLYHENDARITPAAPLTIGCRCSRERIFDMLMSMSVKDRADMVVEGMASVTCQFCTKTERFTLGDLSLAAKQ